MAGRQVTVPTQVNKVFATSPMGSILVYTLTPEKLAGWNYLDQAGGNLINKQKGQH